MFFDREKIKQQLLEFTIQGVEHFLKENPELEFYAFAYDCHAEYAEVGLCFNTQDDFKETLQRYQNGYPEHYQNSSQINELKFSMGDWLFQGTDIIYVFDQQHMNDIYQQLPQDEGQSWYEFIESLMQLFSECILEFTQTAAYNAIPKTPDFLVYAMDHDENFTDIIPRMFSLTNSIMQDGQLKYAELNEKFKMYHASTQTDSDHLIS